MFLDPKVVAVLVLSGLSVLTTAIGVLLALTIRENVRAIAVGIGFSTGIMVLVSALELIPEAQEAVGTPGAGLSTVLGAALLWGANLAIPHSHLVREHGQVDTRLVRSVYLVVTGLILHDVPEGFAMANAYIASPWRSRFTICRKNWPWPCRQWPCAVPGFWSRRPCYPL